MGIFWSKLQGLLATFATLERDCRILMLGIDNAGKTTILYKLQHGECVPTVPTIGFNVETFKFRNVSFTVWDVGGQDCIRKLWYHYFPGSEALIFVVDSADRARVAEARDELHALAARPELEDARSILVLANKQDLPNAISVAELTELLNMKALTRQGWYVQSACAVSGDGLYEGLDWLRDSLMKAHGEK